MLALRTVAVLLALCLMVGECWRSWGAGRPIMFVLDDQLMGGFLLAAALLVRQQDARSRRAFSAAWGVVSGMLYMSFFGKLVDPSGTNAGNWGLGILTLLVGIAFVVGLTGLWFSVVVAEGTNNS